MAAVGNELWEVTGGRVAAVGNGLLWELGNKISGRGVNWYCSVGGSAGKRIGDRQLWEMVWHWKWPCRGMGVAMD